MLVAHGLAVATLLARFNVVTRIASAYLTNCDAEGTARVEPVWASLIVGGTRIAAFLAKVKAATKIAAFLARVKAVTKMLCSLVTINISRAMILYTIGLAVVCVSLWTVIKPQMPLPVLYSVETNSPIFGADGRLTESVRLQTSNVSTVEIVPSGASSYDKTSLTIATVYNDQQSVRITLCRGNNARGSMNHQLGSFSITGISPFKAETTNIRILFLISSNTISIAAQDVKRKVNLGIERTNDGPNSTQMYVFRGGVDIETYCNYGTTNREGTEYADWLYKVTGQQR
jgi:hypothetical protein